MSTATWTPVLSGVCGTSACRCDPMPPSARRSRKTEPHARVGPYQRGHGVANGRRTADSAPLGRTDDYIIWHTTRRSPWRIRADNRRRNRAARATRRAARR